MRYCYGRSACSPPLIWPTAPEDWAQVLLLLSPLLYAALSLLTTWKDLQIGIREWTCTFRISAQIVSALRMLCFGAASVLVCVPANLLLWSVSGHLHPLGWMLALSLSSLFLYGTLSLLCLRLRGMMRILAAPIIWLIIGVIPFDVAASRSVAEHNTNGGILSALCLRSAFVFDRNAPLLPALYRRRFFLCSPLNMSPNNMENLLLWMIFP